MMIYIFPIKPRRMVMRWLLYPVMFFEVLRLHPDLGVKYAAYWAAESLRP